VAREIVQKFSEAQRARRARPLRTNVSGQLRFELAVWVPLALVACVVFALGGTTWAMGTFSGVELALTLWAIVSGWAIVWGWQLPVCSTATGSSVELTSYRRVPFFGSRYRTCTQR
jgi:hypothetical protein